MMGAAGAWISIRGVGVEWRGGHTLLMPASIMLGVVILFEQQHRLFGIVWG